MPIHGDYWDWNWLDRHHDHYWHWTPRIWSSHYHLRCPTRRRYYWGFGADDFDVCSRDSYMHFDDEFWCHRTCLASKVIYETGEEADTNGKGTFKAIIDVHHFRLDELSLKVKNHDTIILKGKQKDDRAEKSPLCITREFTRTYRLPSNYDAVQAKATLSKDGILSVTVPAPLPIDDAERVVEIMPQETYFGSAHEAKDSNIRSIENAENDEEHSKEKEEKKQQEDADATNENEKESEDK